MRQRYPDVLLLVSETVYAAGAVPNSQATARDRPVRTTSAVPCALSSSGDYSAPRYLPQTSCPGSLYMRRVGCVSVVKRIRLLVLFPFNSDRFRANQRCQDKAQPAGNGAPLTRAVTPYWRRWLAPCGRAGKRSLTALRRLARARHYLRGVPCVQPLPDPLNRSELNGKSTRSCTCLCEQETGRPKPPRQMIGSVVKPDGMNTGDGLRPADRPRCIRLLPLAIRRQLPGP